MRKAILIFTAAIFFGGSAAWGQEERPEFGVKISGFVKNDFFWDSRQTMAAREGHFLLWPSPEQLSTDGKDINAKPNFNFLAIQSRLSASITGPDAFGARTSAIIEGDFFAQGDANINLLRLRHAMIKLQWENTSLITGQYWNPLFVTSCFPGTVSFNTGTPLQSFARNPQIRITHSFGKLSVLAAALSQRDFSTRGPDPSDPSKTLVSSSFLRNASIPDMHLQAHYNIGTTESGTSMLFGAGVAWKTVVPRLASVSANKVDEKVSGLTAIAFSKLTLAPVTIKLQGRYGENIADVLSISGFAVRSEDLVTGERTYTPLQNITFWGEIHTNGKKVQAGVMGGALKNMGTKAAMSDVLNPVYGLGTNIALLYRVSPRVVFISNKTKLAFEVEYTVADYGSDHDVNYIPQTVSTVANVRGLMSVIHAF
ncbi:MAG: hypothetical protein K9G38_06505 [Bacteroidales bacterium]|nr:hypothetical protein [Bacteroidales bacterium]